jgi:hypothetical protein
MLKQLVFEMFHGFGTSEAALPLEPQGTHPKTAGGYVFAREWLID